MRDLPSLLRSFFLTHLLNPMHRRSFGLNQRRLRKSADGLIHNALKNAFYSAAKFLEFLALILIEYIYRLWSGL